MAEAQLFPNQIDEGFASVAVGTSDRRSYEIARHATIMSHNGLVAQLGQASVGVFSPRAGPGMPAGQ
jgi:hypothetical protein